MKQVALSYAAFWVGVFSFAALTVGAGNVWRVYAEGGQEPFRLERWIYSSQYGGKLVLKEIVYGDGTGSIGFIRSSRINPDRYVTREIEQIDGLYATMIDELKIAFNVVKPFDQASWRLRAAKSDCVEHAGETIEGVELIDGVSTMKIVIANSSTQKVSAWRAPTLACTELRRMVEAKGSGKVIDPSMEYKLISLSRAHQDPSLFGIPSDYVEVMPSNLYQRLAILSGVEASPQSNPAIAKRYQELDDSYLKQRHKTR